MVFSVTFNNISVLSRRQLTSFMSFLGFTSTKLEPWSVLPKDTPTKKPDWMNGVLSRFQQYFSRITETAYIIHVFHGFHQY